MTYTDVERFVKYLIRVYPTSTHAHTPIYIYKFNSTINVNHSQREEESQLTDGGLLMQCVMDQLILL